jgi:hypothetical protein
MNEPTRQSRRPRWFQFSLRALLVLMLVVAAYFAGFTTSEKLAEKAMREANEKAAVELERTAAELEEAKQAAARTSRNTGAAPRSGFGGMQAGGLPGIKLPIIDPPDPGKNDVFDQPLPNESDLK